MKKIVSFFNYISKLLYMSNKLNNKIRADTGDWLDIADT